MYWSWVLRRTWQGEGERESNNTYLDGAFPSRGLGERGQRSQRGMVRSQQYEMMTGEEQETPTAHSLTGEERPPTLGEKSVKSQSCFSKAHLAHPGRLAYTLLPEGSCFCCPSNLHK